MQFFGLVNKERQKKVILADNFNRADSTTTMGNAQTGQTWEFLSEYGVIWGIDNNKAYSVSNTDFDFTEIETGTVDGELSVNITGTWGATNYSVPVVLFRRLDLFTYLLVYFSTTQVVLMRRHQTLPVTILATNTFTPVNGQEYKVKIVYRKNDILVFIDGELYIAYTLSGDNLVYANYTKIGFRLDTDGTPEIPARWDDLKVVL